MCCCALCLPRKSRSHKMSILRRSKGIFHNGWLWLAVRYTKTGKAREKTQYGEHWLWKHEDLNWVPRVHVTSDMVVYICNPSSPARWEEKTEVPWRLWTSYLACQKNNRWLYLTQCGIYKICLAWSFPCHQSESESFQTSAITYRYATLTPQGCFAIRIGSEGNILGPKSEGGATIAQRRSIQSQIGTQFNWDSWLQRG